MKVEIGTPCIHKDFMVLLLPSSSKIGGSDEHVPFRALNFTPSFARLPILNSADARNSGRKRSVRPQKMSCMFSSVTGSPFFHVNSEQPEAICRFMSEIKINHRSGELTDKLLQTQDDQIALEKRHQDAVPNRPQSIEVDVRLALVTSVTRHCFRICGTTRGDG